MITIPPGLAAEVAARPDWFRPDAAGHEVLVLGATDAGLVGKRGRAIFTPTHRRLVFDLPGLPYLDGREVTAWAIIRPDVRPDPGTRILPLDGEHAGTVQTIARPPRKRPDGSTSFDVFMSVSIDELAILPPPPKPLTRVYVFFYPHEGYCGRGWTWCWELKGVTYDAASDLPKAMATWDEAHAAATNALRARLECAA